MEREEDELNDSCGHRPEISRGDVWSRAAEVGSRHDRECLVEIPELSTKDATGLCDIAELFEEIPANSCAVARLEKRAERGFEELGGIHRRPPLTGQLTPDHMRSTAAFASLSARTPEASMV